LDGIVPVFIKDAPVVTTSAGIEIFSGTEVVVSTTRDNAYV